MSLRISTIRALALQLSRWLIPVAAGCLLACTDSPPRGFEPPNQPHVLLISLDTLRADRLSCYGYSRNTSPFLDQLAASGTLFRHAFVNTHGTPPSHATLFTSLYQESHGVSWHHLEGVPNHRLPDDLPILPEVLRDSGYATVAVTGGGYMSKDFGFDRGFDSFAEDRLEDAVDSLVRQIRRRLDGTPIFAFLHTYEIHSPYDPPQDYRNLWGPLTKIDASSEHLKILLERPGPLDLSGEDLHTLDALYDAGIRFTDDVLRQLFARLEKIGFLEHAVVVVTSDHGEEFAEHGGLLHPAQLYDELLAVPLIMAGPGLPSGRVDSRSVSTLDIAPTIYGLAGVRAPRLAAGRDLLATSGKEPAREIFSQYGDLLYSVRTERYKLIEHRGGGTRRLYDLSQDPGEQNNIAAQHEDVVLELQQRLDSWRSSLWRRQHTADGETELSQERLEQLQSLGYTN